MNIGLAVKIYHLRQGDDYEYLKTIKTFPYSSGFAICRRGTWHYHCEC